MVTVTCEPYREPYRGVRITSGGNQVVEDK